MRIAYLFLALLLASCASDGELADTAPSGPPFRFDITALPPEHQPWAAAAANDWNQGSGELLILIDSNGPHRAVVDSVPGNGTESASRHAGIWTLTIEDEPNPQAGCWIPFYRHGFGHVLESEWDNPSDPFHSPDAADVMYPGVGCNKGITTADLASIAY